MLTKVTFLEPKICWKNARKRTKLHISLKKISGGDTPGPLQLGALPQTPRKRGRGRGGTGGKRLEGRKGRRVRDGRWGRGRGEERGMRRWDGNIMTPMGDGRPWALITSLKLPRPWISLSSAVIKRCPTMSKFKTCAPTEVLQLES
jgi:hypothetical protein